VLLLLLLLLYDSLSFDHQIDQFALVVQVIAVSVRNHGSGYSADAPPVVSCEFPVNASDGLSEINGTLVATSATNLSTPEVAPTPETINH
jgi:hypothetical protein